MSVLTRDEILKEIDKGNIKIEPLDKDNIGPGSVDLTLSNKFRTFKRSSRVFDVLDTSDYKEITELVETDSIIIMPQHTILGITKEKITLSPDICGWLEGRTRYARIGLMVHISASFMQPGISNRQVLEMTNMGHVPLKLHAGTKICQFIFQRTEGKAKYEGQFRDQEEP